MVCRIKKVKKPDSKAAPTIIRMYSKSSSCAVDFAISAEIYLSTTDIDLLT